jgi:hypothetical protein
MGLDELEMMRVEVVMTYFKQLSWHFHGGGEESMEKLAIICALANIQTHFLPNASLKLLSSNQQIIVDAHMLFHVTWKFTYVHRMQRTLCQVGYLTYT